ncbi:MAG TPA: glycosyltransferase family 2 protein [Acidimicrobiales bacterium]|nr:glycosyltransferase family 2 protein [Acidimicrobiales bacterium]
MTAPDLELTVVVPVYDESETIEAVVREVVVVADELAPGRCEVVVVDDGSTDGTGALVDVLAAELPEVQVVHQVNRGHGPALLVGFDRARGRWIGHLDSDDQIPAKELAGLWSERAGADLVLGVRTDRDDPQHRLVLSAVVRRLVGLLAGRPVRDANVPCKLFRADLWAEARPLLPDDVFAPSIALALVAARQGHVIQEVPVAHRARTAGASTLRPLRLARAVATATGQTLTLAWRLRPRPGSPPGRRRPG